MNKCYVKMSNHCKTLFIYGLITLNHSTCQPKCWKVKKNCIKSDIPTQKFPISLYEFWNPCENLLKTPMKALQIKIIQQFFVFESTVHPRSKAFSEIISVLPIQRCTHEVQKHRENFRNIRWYLNIRAWMNIKRNAT